jgi:hypothetical protein
MFLRVSIGGVGSVILFLAACSGGTSSGITSSVGTAGGGNEDVSSQSGLPEGAVVAQMDDANVTQLCLWTESYEAAGAPLQCGATVNPLAQCTSGIRADPTCAATVAQYEECAAAVRADACTALGNPGCGALAACSN